jgi:hypothetical protein
VSGSWALYGFFSSDFEFFDSKTPVTTFQRSTIGPDFPLKYRKYPTLKKIKIRIIRFDFMKL